MIVLDTNALRDGGWGPRTTATLLKGLARTCGHPLALPQMTLNEALSHYRREVDRALSRSDLSSLLSLVPAWLGRAGAARGLENTPPLPNSAVKDYEKGLRKVYKVLSTPTGAAEDAHRREVERIPPASSAGGEGRDAVIWLTALHAAKESKPSMVHFVSSDGTYQHEDTRRLKPDLAREASPNLRYLTSVDALIDRLSCETEHDPDLATSHDVTHVVQQTAMHGHFDPNHELRHDLWDWTPAGLSAFGGGLQVSASLLDDSTPTVEARSVGTTRLTAIDAVYRLHLQWSTLGNEEVSVRLGILVKHEDNELAVIRVLSRSGIRSLTSLT